MIQNTSIIISFHEYLLVKEFLALRAQQRLSLTFLDQDNVLPYIDSSPVKGYWLDNVKH